MKKIGFLRFLLIIVGVIILVNQTGCDIGTFPRNEVENEDKTGNENEIENEDETGNENEIGSGNETGNGKETGNENETENGNEPIDLVDSAFWFGEIYGNLIDRIGEISSEDYSGDMGQIANCQYVCNAINAKWYIIYPRIDRVPLKSKLVSKTTDGLVPMLPDETLTTKFLRQDGTWQIPPDKDTAYNVVSKNADGLTPKLPDETSTTKYLRQDVTWQVPPDNSIDNTKLPLACGIMT